MVAIVPADRVGWRPGVKRTDNAYRKGLAARKLAYRP
jgi:hypothetical protein